MSFTDAKKIGLNLGLSGEVRCVIRKQNTQEIVRDTGFFPNLITDEGLKYVVRGGDSPMYYLAIGSGSTPPQVTDTDLEHEVSINSTYNAGYFELHNTHSTNVIKDEENKLMKGFTQITTRFGNIDNINITELGFKCYEDKTLFTRALIKDSRGEPTTITVRQGEVLDVTYRVWCVYSSESEEFTLAMPNRNGDSLIGTKNIKLTSYPKKIFYNHLLYYTIKGNLFVYNAPRQDSIVDRYSNAEYKAVYVKDASFDDSLKIAKSTIGTKFSLSEANWENGIKAAEVNVDGLASIGFDIEDVETPDKGILKNNHQTLTIEFELSLGRFKGDKETLLHGLQ